WLDHIYGAPIQSIATGDSHSMALTTGGVVWAWGANGVGPLGCVGPDTLRPNVVEGRAGARVTRIAGGSFRSLCVTSEGRAFSFGKGSDGQLGHGDTNNSAACRVISELLGTRIVQCSGGRKDSFLIDDTGRVHGFGSSSLVNSSIPVV